LKELGIHTCHQWTPPWGECRRGRELHPGASDAAVRAPPWAPRDEDLSSPLPDPRDEEAAQAELRRHHELLPGIRRGIRATRTRARRCWIRTTRRLLGLSATGRDPPSFLLDGTHAGRLRLPNLGADGAKSHLHRIFPSWVGSFPHLLHPNTPKEGPTRLGWTCCPNQTHGKSLI
jgi:hypothetical protein